MSRDDMAIGTDGNPLPWSPEQVRAHVLKMVERGEILAVIIEDEHGDIAVQVFGRPSRRLLNVLRQATDGYEKTLRGH